MRDQKVCQEFDLLFSKVMEEDLSLFNYFVSYALGVMKNKIDEFDLELMQGVYDSMKKVREEDPVVDPSTLPPGSITPGIPEVEDYNIEVSDCCYADYACHLLGEGSINMGPPDPVEYCVNCQMRCGTIWITKEELERFHLTGEKVKR